MPERGSCVPFCSRLRVPLERYITVKYLVILWEIHLSGEHAWLKTTQTSTVWETSLPSLTWMGTATSGQVTDSILSGWPLKTKVSSGQPCQFKKPITETRVLLGETEGKSISPSRGQWFALQANQWYFYKMETEKNWVRGQTWAISVVASSSPSPENISTLHIPRRQVWSLHILNSSFSFLFCWLFTIKDQ